MQTNKGEGLRVGQTVEFEIEVELLSCPKNRDEWISHFSIYPVGVREELLVHVEMLCDCGCSKGEVSDYERFLAKSVDMFETTD